MKWTPSQSQCEMTAHLRKNRSTLLIADKGAGKTSTVLHALRNWLATGRYKGALIVSPLRPLYLTWLQEIALWDDTVHLTYTVLHGRKVFTDSCPKTDLYFINFESLVWLLETSLWFPFDILIIDECTKIKNADAKRTRAVLELSKYCKIRISMTATPGDLAGLWGQLMPVDRGRTLPKSFSAFRNIYFEKDPFTGEYHPLPGAARHLVKQAGARIYRQKARETNFPAVVQRQHIIPLSGELTLKYRELHDEMVLTLQDSETYFGNPLLATEKCRQFLAGGVYAPKSTGECLRVHSTKLQYLKSMLQGINVPVLIAYWYRFEWEGLQETFPGIEDLKAPNQKHLERVLKQWNAHELKYLAVHPASAGHGLNLQAGHVLVWLTLPWSYELYDQMVGRICRTGQKNTPEEHVLICRPGTRGLDDVVWKSLKRKGDVNFNLVKELTQSGA